MYCPICNNLVSSGRCPHSLAERSQGLSRLAKIDDDYKKGRIDVGQAVKRRSNIK